MMIWYPLATCPSLGPPEDSPLHEDSAGRARHEAALPLLLEVVFVGITYTVLRISKIILTPGFRLLAGNIFYSEFF